MATKKPSLQELQKHWYKKIKDAGFQDIERDEYRLKVNSSDKFGKNKALVQNGGWQAKATYYQMAASFLEEYKFDSNLDKVIWEYHANGLSMRDISNTLKKVKVRVKMSKSVIHRLLYRLKMAMYAMYMVEHKEYRD